MGWMSKGYERGYQGTLLFPHAQIIKSILRQILAGLSKLHTLGIVHRDVKPDNLLVTTDGEVRAISHIKVCSIDFLASSLLFRFLTLFIFNLLSYFHSSFRSRSSTWALQWTCAQV